jgi:acetyl-CoA carboxylase biotin carboxyl carrier protein
MRKRPSISGRKETQVPAKPRADTFIDPKVLQELIDIFQTAGLADLEIERGGLRVRLRKEEAAPPLPVREVSVQVPDQATTFSTPVQTSLLSASAGLLTVTSPIVGIFYRSASPDTEAYVEEGAYVRKGHVLCIVEAMKLMNEIESEVDGRVVKILLENAKPVEYGEPLFLIEPGVKPEE